jgi:hypothetical protein
MRDKTLSKRLESNVNRCRLLAVGMELRFPAEVSYAKLAEAVSLKYGYRLMKISPSKATRVS